MSLLFRFTSFSFSPLCQIYAFGKRSLFVFIQNNNGTDGNKSISACIKQGEHNSENLLADKQIQIKI